jgi:hypothetical protein
VCCVAWYLVKVEALLGDIAELVDDVPEAILSRQSQEFIQLLRHLLDTVLGGCSRTVRKTGSDQEKRIHVGQGK